MSTTHDSFSSAPILANKPPLIYELNQKKQRKEFPWMGKIEEKEGGDFPSSLYHQELLNFADWVSPTPEERAMRTDVVERLKSIILGIYPEAKVDTFLDFLISCSSFH